MTANNPIDTEYWRPGEQCKCGADEGGWHVPGITGCRFEIPGDVDGRVVIRPGFIGYEEQQRNNPIDGPSTPQEPPRCACKCGCAEPTRGEALRFCQDCGLAWASNKRKHGPSVHGDNERDPQPTSDTGAPQEGAVPWRDGEVNIHHGATALVTMACCGFTFSAEHTDADGGYSCPICEPVPVAASGAGAETPDCTSAFCGMSGPHKLTESCPTYAYWLEEQLQEAEADLRAATARADRAEAALTRLRELPAKMRGIKAISGRPHAYIKGIERGLQLAAEEVEAALRSAASPAAATEEASDA